MEWAKQVDGVEPFVDSLGAIETGAHGAREPWIPPDDGDNTQRDRDEEDIPPEVVISVRKPVEASAPSFVDSVVGE
jgi:hypothetical protein